MYRQNGVGTLRKEGRVWKGKHRKKNSWGQTAAVRYSLYLKLRSKKIFLVIQNFFSDGSVIAIPFPINADEWPYNHYVIGNDEPDRSNKSQLRRWLVCHRLPNWRASTVSGERLARSTLRRRESKWVLTQQSAALYTAANFSYFNTQLVHLTAQVLNRLGRYSGLNRILNVVYCCRCA